MRIWNPYGMEETDREKEREFHQQNFIESVWSSQHALAGICASTPAERQ